VSDPRTAKQALELNQVREFLCGARVPYTRVERGDDPPDLVVHREGSLPLGIEVTEYHPQDQRVAFEKRWKEFQDAIDPLLEVRPLLAGIGIHLSFHDPRVPQHRYHYALALEVVRCTEFVRQEGWDGARPLSLSFLDMGEQRLDRLDQDDWILGAADWPELKEHVSHLDIVDHHVLYRLPISSYQADTAGCSPSADALRRILDGKEYAIRKAIKRGRYAPAGPLWLLVVANNVNDLSSFAFADGGLKGALDSSGFDFQASVFQEVWMSEACGPGRALRLYPWDGLGTALAES
jgi:hypothetical protein